MFTLKILKIKVSDDVQAVSNPPNSTQPQSYGSIIEKSSEISPENSTENSSIMIKVNSDSDRWKEWNNTNLSGRYQMVRENVNNRPVYKVSFILTKST